MPDVVQFREANVWTAAYEHVTNTSSWTMPRDVIIRVLRIEKSFASSRENELGWNLPLRTTPLQNPELIRDYAGIKRFFTDFENFIDCVPNHKFLHFLLLPVFLHLTEQLVPTSCINSPFLRHSTSLRHLIPHNDLPLHKTVSFIRCTSFILFCPCVFVPLMIHVLCDNITPYRLASRQLRVHTSQQGVTSQTTKVFSNTAVRISYFLYVSLNPYA